MSTEPTPELLERIAQKKADMETARRGMKEGIKYSSRSLGGHTTQYRKLCRLAGIIVRTGKADLTEARKAISYTIGKPCRYKACKGRNHKAHGEKCPVASARGKTGGKNGEGESKQRLGSTNGNFKAVRPCGCPMRAHKPTCEHARLTARKDFGLSLRKNVREKINVRKIEWASQALTVAAVTQYLRGVDGICPSCNKTLPAVTASKVHKDDIMSNPVRVICKGCDQ
ncbi:MAG: hypothetical protein CMF55_00525 [Legionellales bacterium]|nr:hypothetical protein [Legionellales bacterium]